MRIVSLRIEVATARYAVPFTITGETSPVMETLLVHVEADSGGGGTGEVNPMPAYSGVPIAAVRHEIEVPLTQALVGASALPAVAHARMDRACRGPAAPLAKAAVDIALYDLLGRRLGVPVSTLLGGAHRGGLAVVWPVGLRDVEDTVEEARARYAEGYETIKLKVGKDPQRDVAAVRAVRDALRAATLRVDANGGYDPETAIDVLGAVEDCGLEFVEQPVPSGDLSCLRRVRKATGMRIFADESVQSPSDVLDLISAEACDGVNVKITKPGGLYRACQTAGIAEAAGLSVLVGSMPEMGVATAAGLHFAQSLPDCGHATELVGPAVIDRDVIGAGQMRYSHGMLSLVGAEPGLGVSTIR